jgi:general secretion pathway protein E/type IV pilus assembly protein PilB
MPAATEMIIDVAHRAGRLSEEQIAAATTQQEAGADEFGRMPSLVETVVAMEFITELELCTLAAGELGLPVADLTDLRVGGEVLGQVSREQALRHEVMPLSMEPGRLLLAVADPFDLGAVDELGHLLGVAIDTEVATRSQVLAAIERHYGAGEEDVTTVEAGSLVEEEASEDTDDEPVVRTLHGIMGEAVRRQASDIHLEPLERRFRVRYRIDGRLLEVEGPPKRLQLALISRVKIMADLSIAEKRLPQDGRIQLRVEGKPIDLRVSTVPTAHGESVVMRILDAEGLKPYLGELGLAEEDVSTLRSLTGQADGMVLVTGPTGSGKTTTLYSCLQEINRPDRKIITVEDPVEYQLSGINQVPVRGDVGLSFAAALRAMLRQAPNVVMVGEIRDRETSEIAINAALTGHLVFSTLHTNDAPSAVTRLVDLGVPPFLVASALRASVAQRLVRRVCPACRSEAPPTAAEREVFAAEGIEVETLCRGEGCAECNGTGYRGRVALFEFFVVNPEIERMIHEHAGLPALRKEARRWGLRSLRHDGLRKAAQGVTTFEEVLAATVSETAHA